TSIDNTASLSGQSPTDPNGNNSSLWTVAVSREADLAVTKTGPASANAGEYVTYTISVLNTGPSDGSSATLNDTLSSQFASGAKYCTGSLCDPSTGLSWTGTYSLGAITAGSTVTVKIRAQIMSSST